jgi:glycosyltransferase involved in cell wall biosynthesis
MLGSPWGGSEFLWSSAAHRALERGHNVLAVTGDWNPRPQALVRLDAAGVASCTYPLFKTQSAGFATRLFRRLRGELTRLGKSQLPTVWHKITSWRPDFICVSQSSSYDVAWQPEIGGWLRRLGIPYGLICQHNFEHLVLGAQNREIIRASYQNARWVAFVARGNLQKAERELGDRIPNACVVFNPVNLINLEPVSWPNPGPICFGCVARLEAGCKGQDLLLEALAQERWRDRDWHLRLYGEGPDREYLSRVAKMFGISHRVAFAGHVADVRQIWADNHIFVLPSRSEGTPLSLIEAMVCGRPAIVTDVGGNAEWITEQDTGFVAEAPSVGSLSSALERAWAARSFWQTMGESASQQVLKRLDPDPGGSLLNLIERPTGLST